MVRPAGRFRAARRRSCAGWPPAAKRAPARRRAAARQARARAARARAGAALARAAGSASRCRAALPRLPVLDQRQRDVLGLALVALGVFMGFVLYGSARGRRARRARRSRSALGWALGRARVLAPVALVVGGGALLLRPVLPALRPLRTGAALPVRGGHARARGGHARPQLRRRAAASGRGARRYLQAHGGVVGEALYQLAHRLVQGVGVDILVVFLLLVGVILLTGRLARGRAARDRQRAASTRRAWCARIGERGRAAAGAGRRRASSLERRSPPSRRAAAARARAGRAGRARHARRGALARLERAAERRADAAGAAGRASAEPSDAAATSRAERDGERGRGGGDRRASRTPTRPSSRRRAGCATR